jgi:predicted transcriptional regulator of viral defense system
MGRTKISVGTGRSQSEEAHWQWTEVAISSKIDGVPVRIYSAAKTIDDCFKYGEKIGRNFAAKTLEESIASKKCSEQRLRRFAEICRVRKLVQAARYSPDVSG